VAEHVVGHVIEAVTVKHPRSVRRHELGGDHLAGQLAGLRVESARRRGKFLWLTFDDPEVALVVHLGMSGQLLARPADAPMEKHAHIVAALSSGSQLRFVDQRTFGGWALNPLVEVDGTVLPESVAHIARDPLDLRFDADAVVELMRRKQSEVKRVLLDQTVVSGIGNIYADEALWRVGMHGERIAATLARPALHRLLTEVQAVLRDALRAGGTSFDALYVNVNGQSGYFERSLAAYGREDEPCRRCGAPIRREKFMNRSSFSCPRCQPRPRR
jgi:formamidopyrimidine-DNA glycosylase